MSAGTSSWELKAEGSGYRKSDLFSVDAAMGYPNQISETPLSYSRKEVSLGLCPYGDRRSEAEGEVKYRYLKRRGPID